MHKPMPPNRFRLPAMLILITLSMLIIVGSNFSVSSNSGKGKNTTAGKTSAQDSVASQINKGSETQQTGTPQQESTTPVTNLPKGQVMPQSGEMVQVLIELTDLPATKVYAQTLERSTLSKAQAKIIAGNASRQQTVTLKQKQQTLAAAIAGRGIQMTEIYRVQRAFNGIAVSVPANAVDTLRSLPGVKAVHPLELEYPGNSTSVPFLGTPQVWENTLGLPYAATGAGIKIGVIDTGIDYQHATFGGTGVLADYQANVRTVAPDAFYPTAKVVGGFDFAGDAYTGGNTPVPDPDPMDCNGHGTHVSGTAAGFGVNNDGTTYSGAFNTATPFANFRIGPGSAPQAQLYALRVFGCTGGTNLTVQAIDWATDPNDDGDVSDHLDVINMSLGSNFGTLTNTSSVASDNAVLAGVIVVTSAGNAGDTFFIAGAPGAATRVLSTAASIDGGQSANLVLVNSPAGIAGYKTAGVDSFTGPPHAAMGQTADVVLALDPSDGAGVLTTDGCSTLTNPAALAGKIALIDRGTCGFQVKAANAQAAGAIGLLVANTAAGAFGNMGPTAGQPDITIPCFMITFADANAIKAQLANGPVNVTLLSGGDLLASFSSRGPRQGASIILKPDIAAPGSNITSAQTGVTCPSGACQTPNATGFLAGNQALTISGTSMASPHMAGIMALLKQLHPDWTVEELKALAMNGAHHDVTELPQGQGNRYGPGRIGAGRVDVPKSAIANIVAFGVDEPGAVSVSFDTEVTGSITRTKKIRVVNKGTTAATFDLGIDTVVDAPGVSYSLPGGSTVTVAAGQTAEFDVQLNANAAQMDHTREATVAATQLSPSASAQLTALGNVSRHWLTEEAGYVTLSQSGNLKMRVPVYTSVRPASNMSAADTIATGGNPTGSTTIPLSGGDVCTGTLGAGPVCTGTFPTDEVSLVTPFELQAVSPRNTAIPAFTDIQYAGVAYDPVNNILLFGVSTWGKWSTPTQFAVNIWIDGNEDGTYERIIFNSNPGSMAAGFFATTNTAQDSFVNGFFTVSPAAVGVGGASLFVNRLSSAAVDTALFNNNVMFLAATPAQMGLAAGDTTFRYKVETTSATGIVVPRAGGFFDSVPGPFFFNYNAQGLNFGGASLIQDLNGGTIPVTWNTANMTTNGSLGALLLHHHNGEGKTAEVVLLQGTAYTDLSITKSASPMNPTLGQNVTFTLTVTNNGSTAANGITVSDQLPAGLTYVSDNGGGAYNSITGLWTLPGSFGAGGSATLQIVATVNTTDAVKNTAQITASTPLDPNPANNQASVTLMAPRQSDLGVSETVSSPTVLPGGTVNYTITVTNNGNDPAFSVAVQETFPAFPALNPSSFTASQGVYNPSTGLWNIASLGDGASATLTITVTVPAGCGAFTNQATISSSTSDANSVNNIASASTTILDQVAPTITCTSNVTKSTDPNQCQAVVTYTAPVVSDNCSGVGTPSCTPSSGSVFPKGTTTVNCSVMDASNNPASCSFTVTVNDTQNPTLSCPGNITQAAAAGLCTAVVTYAAPIASDNCSGVGTPSCTPTSGSTFNKGVTTVNCSVMDASGNSGSCSFTVTVTDMQVPVITCPANIIRTTPVTCPASVGMVVTYTAPTASDNCGSVSVSCSPASGSTFPVGTTTVTCTANDGSNTATCTFKVKVFDICLQDNSSTSAMLFINSLTGEYAYCCNGQTYTGTGTISKKGCSVTLTLNTAQRRVSATVDLSLKRGSATLQSPPGSMLCTINDTDMSNNSCNCTFSF
jgi:uncharacterized repeat protein (TIGR01451 family)